MSVTHALVLTGAPGALDNAIVRLAAAAASRAHVTAQPLRWLADGLAADIAFDLGQMAAGAVGDTVRVALVGCPVDINVVALKDRRKRLLVADMDSTIIQQECIDEMADLFGLKERISAITERAMRGELDFEAALKERLGLQLFRRLADAARETSALRARAHRRGAQ